MKAFCCATLALVALAVAVSASSIVDEGKCSYSVHRSCSAADSSVRSNLLLSSLDSIKLGERKKSNFPRLKYGTGGGEDSEDEIYAQALCPCECSRCPKPLKAKSSEGEEDDNKCLCACGTCGRTPSKNKLPAVVPLDCNLKCEVISEVQTKPSGSYGSGSSSSYPAPPAGYSPEDDVDDILDGDDDDDDDEDDDN